MLANTLGAPVVFDSLGLHRGMVFLSLSDAIHYTLGNGLLEVTSTTHTGNVLVHLC